MADLSANVHHNPLSVPVEYTCTSIYTIKLMISNNGSNLVIVRSSKWHAFELGIIC